MSNFYPPDRISSLYSLSLAIRDIESLLLLDKPPLKRPANPLPSKKNSGKIKEKEKDPYNRDQYWNYAADKKAALLKLYGFCFALAKPP
jgi:DCN1-like protein 4/5